MIKQFTPRKKIISWFNLIKLKEDKKNEIKIFKQHLIDFNIENTTLIIGYSDYKCYKITLDILLESNLYNQVEIIINKDEIKPTYLSMFRLCLQDLKENLYPKPYFNIYELEPLVLNIVGGWYSKKNNNLKDQVNFKVKVLKFNLTRSTK